MLATVVLGALLFTHGVSGHIAAFGDGMYCRNGPQLEDNPNTNAIVLPLFMLPRDQWWMHHSNLCDEFPPPAGQYLELKAGEEITLELASNRGQTTLSFGGAYADEWPDGQPHPENLTGTPCLFQPNLHTHNEATAAGTAIAISYQSDIKNVTPENLAVVSVKYSTPFRRMTKYKIPARLPPCPPQGCHCAWGWVPHGCGEPNMYMEPFKCNVTGWTSTIPIPPAVPPVWCEDDPSKCVIGPKQMIFWNQLDGNNIVVSGNDLSGDPKSPAYNMKCGYHDGPQDDAIPPASSNNVLLASLPVSSDTVSSSPPASTGTPVPSSVPPLSSGSMPAPPPSSIPPLPSMSAPPPSSVSPLPNMPDPSVPPSSSAPGPSGTPGQCGKKTSYVKKSSIARGLAMHKRRLDHNGGWQ